VTTKRQTKQLYMGTTLTLDRKTRRLILSGKAHELEK
jgi:hypothetical protein